MDILPALQRYPIKLTLEDGTDIELRPLDKDDKIGLAKFFQRVSEEDRFYLKENVTAPEVIHNWIDNLDYDRVVPIVAVADDNIVADGTLHRSRVPARRHVGELRVVVDPDFRSKGLGSRLIHELVDLGRVLELDKLYFTVRDTGIGVEAELIEKNLIYESFYQADSSTTREYDGICGPAMT